MRNKIGNASLNVDCSMERQTELLLECEKIQIFKLAHSSAGTTYSVPKKSFKSLAIPHRIKELLLALIRKQFLNLLSIAHVIYSKHE
jgi:hypothetical protein